MLRNRWMALAVVGMMAGVFSCSARADEPVAAPAADATVEASVLDLTMKKLDGSEVNLADYKGKVVLIVNVASKCGLTRSNYTQLQKLHEAHKGDGLAILGFPCNQFGGQEPGSAEDIQQFCEKNYGVTFDVFSKVSVNGDEACELYKKLKAIEVPPVGTGEVKWNFEKFLINRKGELVGRFKPRTAPSDEGLMSKIKAELEKEAG